MFLLFGVWNIYCKKFWKVKFFLNFIGRVNDLKMKYLEIIIILLRVYCKEDELKDLLYFFEIIEFKLKYVEIFWCEVVVIE